MGIQRLCAACAAGTLVVGTAAVRSQDAPPGAAGATPAQRVTITATRVAEPVYDVPASIDVVTLDPVNDDRTGINISETLSGVPGVLARDRQNYAQDVQISVRGFGARSTFGIRGVRLYVDGIPATMPDGQGQITNVDLESAASVEVLRGPFSALYGNSSGGVLNVFTEEGAGAPRLEGVFGLGSNGQHREGLKLTGSSGAVGYVLSGTHFQTDGWRDHSAARRDIENAKLTLRADADSTITIVANAVDVPNALDPMGLTRAEMQADPRSVDSSALDYDTRKTTRQNQLGATYARNLGGSDAVKVMIYGGHRFTMQFQSITTGAEQSLLSPGGVIRLDRDYAGTDARWTHTTTLAGGPASLVAGFAMDTLREHRTGYNNYVGTGADQQLGVLGALRRDEDNGVDDFDPYLQAQWKPSADWTLAAGVRRSTIRFISHDHFINDVNPDDSGSAHDVATLPVAAAMFAISPALHAYATVGRGFETPTLNEIAYRPNGETGLNFDLRPSRSDNAEIGLKGRAGALGDWTAALFDTHTHDEIVTLSSSGGRAVYQNVASTRRRGVELSWQAHPFEHWDAALAYTFLDATYRSGFLTCTVSRCPVANVPVEAGNRMPGIARHSLDGTLDWSPLPGVRAGVEARYLSSVAVNDTNSDAAPGFIVASLHAGWSRSVGAWNLSAFARLDNLLDKRYIGSVIVNETNGRYFEPAPGRTWFAGASASMAF